MQNMSDHELDNLFKEAAEGFTPPQDENAWKQMAARLDQHAITTAGFWNWKTISGAALIGLVALTGLWYAATNDREEITKFQKKNGSNNATQGVVQEQKEQPHPAGNENLTSAQSVESTGNGTRAVNTVEQVSSNTTVQNKNTSISSDKDSTVKTSGETKSGYEEPELNRVNINQIPLAEETVVNPERSQSSNDAITEMVTDSVQSETNEIGTDSTLQVAEPSDKKEDKVKTGSGLSLKAIISPDFSSVKFFSAGKTGVNYGLLAGYSFNNRWSVFTGVIYSKKLYTSTDIEGSYSWDGHDYPMKEIDGDCRILDIPVNVYYTFFPDRNFSLRAGLGLSSYIMRKENYVYCVDNYGSDVYYNQKVRGKNNEWFKVLNVSVAVARKLTPRLSAEFEPFVKAPLAGVGEGKVSLVSMGAFINVRFDLTNNK